MNYLIETCLISSHFPRRRKNSLYTKEMVEDTWKKITPDYSLLLEARKNKIVLVLPVDTLLNDIRKMRFKNKSMLSKECQFCQAFIDSNIYPSVIISLLIHIKGRLILSLFQDLVLKYPFLSGPDCPHLYYWFSQKHD
jgi:hypothetical protein